MFHGSMYTFVCIVCAQKSTVLVLEWDLKREKKRKSMNRLYDRRSLTVQHVGRILPCVYLCVIFGVFFRARWPILSKIYVTAKSSEKIHSKNQPDSKQPPSSSSSSRAKIVERTTKPPSSSWNSNHLERTSLPCRCIQHTSCSSVYSLSRSIVRSGPVGGLLALITTIRDSCVYVCSRFYLHMCMQFSLG